jgi:hypothetical protein
LGPSEKSRPFIPNLLDIERVYKMKVISGSRKAIPVIRREALVKSTKIIKEICNDFDKQI